MTAHPHTQPLTTPTLPRRAFARVGDVRPLFSTDIFNYVAYARMGALCHVNPYLHGAAVIAGDPSVPFTGPTWLHTPTAYGPLFTLISYALVPLGVAGTMWALKALTALAAFGPHVLSVLNLLEHHDQFTKPLSNVPGYLGYVLGQGPLTPARHHTFELVFDAGAVALLGVAWWRRDWLAAGGGALLL